MFHGEELSEVLETWNWDCCIDMNYMMLDIFKLRGIMLARNYLATLSMGREVEYLTFIKNFTVNFYIWSTVIWHM